MANRDETMRGKTSLQIQQEGLEVLVDKLRPADAILLVSIDTFFVSITLTAQPDTISPWAALNLI